MLGSLPHAGGTFESWVGYGVGGVLHALWFNVMTSPYLFPSPQPSFCELFFVFKWKLVFKNTETPTLRLILEFPGDI